MQADGLTVLSVKKKRASVMEHVHTGFNWLHGEPVTHRNDTN